MNKKTFYGWKGFIHYFKSFSSKYSEKYVSKNRSEKLLLYYSIQRLIRNSATTFGQRESRIAEFKFYFQEGKLLKNPQDVDHFIEIMKHIKGRLESGVYPPFPRLFPSVFAIDTKRDRLYHRKFMLNIERNDYILEPGQDPVRQPFMEPKQYSSELLLNKDYYANVTTGIMFPEEELIFEGKKSLKSVSS